MLTFFIPEFRLSVCFAGARETASWIFVQFGYLSRQLLYDRFLLVQMPVALRRYADALAQSLLEFFDSSKGSLIHSDCKFCSQTCV